MAEKPIIEVQGLTKRFKGLTAVHDVSFSVEKGSITGMIGPNGSCFDLWQLKMRRN